MTIKKYRVCLILVLIMTIVLGVVIMVQNAEEESSYRDGIMVYEEYGYDGEAYL